MNYEEILSKHFGYSTLKPQQREIIDNIINRNNVIGILPTGFGKSICFQLSSLILDGVTLVISPLIALMQDQVIALNKRNISSCYINSSLDIDEIKKISKDALTIIGLSK